jgi:ketosteroid isomerase-like protein
VTVDAKAAVQRIADTLAGGDGAAIADILAGDAVVWHNYDGRDVPAAQAFTGVAQLHALVDGLRVDIVQDETISGGAVARLEIRGTVRGSGRPLLARNCIFVTITEGRVRRIDEYVDPTFGSQLGT